MGHLNAPDHDARLELQRRAGVIFEQAIETPTRARTQFLDQACINDPKLRAEVDTLLRAHPEASAWFDAVLREQLDAALEHDGTVHATLASAGGTKVGAVQVDAAPHRPELTTGSTISHYRLERLLGTGGMGEVYEAWDLALGRHAAVKILRSGVSEDLRQRLAREAEMISRLGHPAIATFYETGESLGVFYLAMELVHGETLRSRLRRGCLPFEDSLSITMALLEALVHAHAAGILHRDIKPENIMLTSASTPKLLDFGIAKAIALRDSRARGDQEATGTDVPTVTQLTGHGVIVGTLGYMAPEQLRGETVSESSDVFALGATLYEMLTGEPAFPGETAVQRIASVMTREVPPISGPGIPAALDAILRRALAREPGDRYHNARSFLSALRNLAAEPNVAGLPNTLAIFDFANLTGSTNDNWIGSGIAESLCEDLGRVPGLALVPRSKVLQVRAGIGETPEPLDLAQLGLAVGCRWALTGRYERLGNALKLTTKLIEAATERELWSETLDGRMDDIFTMQARLAKLTIRSLRLIVAEEDSKPTGKRIDAFEFYARGKRIWDKQDRSTMDQAQENFQRAIELDPNHAPALAWLAATHAPGRWLSTTDPRDLELGIEYASRALQSDPGLVDAAVWLGYALWRQHRLQEAIESFDRAMALAPSNPWAPYFAGGAQMEMGNFEAAVRHGQRAVNLDPRMAHFLNCLGLSHLELEHFHEARWSFEAGWKLEERGTVVGWVGNGQGLAECLRRAGALDEARGQCLVTLAFIEKSPHPFRDKSRAECLCVLGRIAMDQASLETARVAYGQAVLYARSHVHTCSMGHLLVQGLAGLSRASSDGSPLEEGLRLFHERSGYNFSWGGLASNGVTLLELGRAAQALGRRAEAAALLESARLAGSSEACHVGAHDKGR